MSEDPIGLLGQDVNLYNYVWNSPLEFSDPSGLTAKDDLLNRMEIEVKGGGGGAPPFSMSAKVQGQMCKRGWDNTKIQEALNTTGIPASGKNGPATRFVHPSTGQSVVRDNATGEIFHVGGPGYKYD